ncbi:class I SAM-dependent methyltransferase [Caulobacter sp. KR2-114]|uniref:class I SAM-dependent methyltransferase n=1 Tax=Caulobacter sp. KR2-114 TaxID=3400912 RepID=UPI003C054836
MPPRDPTSSYLRRWLAKVGLARGPVLDLPGGHGRHTRWLLCAGHSVISADLEPQRMVQLAALSGACSGFFGAVVLDANKTLPFQEKTFVGAVVTDFVCAPLLQDIAGVLQPGGWLLFETFANRGENWRQLPAPGEVERQLRERFVLEDYREGAAGPERTAVTVKCFARLRAP